MCVRDWLREGRELVFMVRLMKTRLQWISTTFLLKHKNPKSVCSNSVWESEMDCFLCLLYVVEKWGVREEVAIGIGFRATGRPPANSGNNWTNCCCQIFSDSFLAFVVFHFYFFFFLCLMEIYFTFFFFLLYMKNEGGMTHVRRNSDEWMAEFSLLNTQPLMQPPKKALFFFFSFFFLIWLMHV